MAKSFALLGSTGMVGQTVIHLARCQNQFQIQEVISGPQRLGKKYEDQVSWVLNEPMPEAVKGLIFQSVEDIQSRYVISALPSDIARGIETALVQKGHIVVSNSSAHRLNPDALLLVPEVNAFCLKEQKPQSGLLITNPNCVVAILSVVLAPLMKQNLLSSLSLTTLQSASGAGYPGVPSMDLLGNVIPFIAGEENKIIEETRYIFKKPEFPISVQCTRVPVRIGHMIACDATFKQRIQPDEFINLLKTWSHENQHVIKINTLDQTFPQPLKALKPYDMSVYVGRIQKGIQENQLRFVVLGDNLGRGAAGAALANLMMVDRLYS
jgi:aspartate-semialdehyde dehydrogenase